MDAWGWSLLFIFAFPLLAIALYIRVKVEESPVVEELQTLNDRPPYACSH